jgi:hypothetical protein
MSALRTKEVVPLVEEAHNRGLSLSRSNDLDTHSYLLIGLFEIISEMRDEIDLLQEKSK